MPKKDDAVQELKNAMVGVLERLTDILKRSPDQMEKIMEQVYEFNRLLNEMAKLKVSPENQAKLQDLKKELNKYAKNPDELVKKLDEIKSDLDTQSKPRM